MEVRVGDRNGSAGGDARLTDHSARIAEPPARTWPNWQKMPGTAPAFFAPAAAMADIATFLHGELPMLTSRALGTSLDRMFALNRPFEQAFTASLSSRISAPPMDVAERDDAYLVHAELPGVSPDQVDITFEQNVLTIRGTKPASFDAANQGELRVFAAERVHGMFERSVQARMMRHRVGLQFRQQVGKAGVRGQIDIALDAREHVGAPFGVIEDAWRKALRVHRQAQHIDRRNQ